MAFSIFCNDYVLFDLPKVSEQLEQRIGRLDRVGQKKDINIHVPYITESFEEVLFRWYHEVFESFSKAPKGAAEFYSNKKEETKAPAVAQTTAKTTDDISAAFDDLFNS